eukprot:279256-Prymnesium_polylepis.1
MVSGRPGPATTSGRLTQFFSVCVHTRDRRHTDRQQQHNGGGGTNEDPPPMHRGACRCPVV